MIEDDGDKISHTIKKYIDNRDDTLQGIIRNDRRNQDFKIKEYRAESIDRTIELHKDTVGIFRKLNRLLVLLSFSFFLLSAVMVEHHIEHQQKEVKK